MKKKTSVNRVNGRCFSVGVVNVNNNVNVNVNDNTNVDV